MNDKPIEQELQEATSIKKRATEKPGAYRLRLANHAAEKLPNDVWEALTTKAQEWVNAAVNAGNEGNDAPAFPDAPEPEDTVETEQEQEEEDEDEDDDEAADEDEGGEEEEAEAEEEDRPAAKVKAKPKEEKRKVAKEQKAKAAKSARGNGGGAPAAKVKKEKRKREPGAQHFIKMMLAKKPSSTIEQIQAALKAKGLKATPSAISSIRSGFLGSMKVMQDAGLLNKNVEL